jgi:hypothetical protein
MKTIIPLLIAVVTLSVGGRALGAELFPEKETSLSLFASYVDKDDSDIGPGIGGMYFLTRNLGLGAFTYWENWGGTFIDNLSGEAHYRIPIDSLNLAPYGLGAFGYSFETEEAFGAVGFGAEWRLNEKWGIFGDLRWQMNADTDDGAGVRIGMRMLF